MVVEVGVVSGFWIAVGCVNGRGLCVEGELMAAAGCLSDSVRWGVAMVEGGIVGDVALGAVSQSVLVEEVKLSVLGLVGRVDVAWSSVWVSPPSLTNTYGTASAVP